MKYSINLNQEFLADTKLDLIDAAILDYLYVYCNSQNERIEKNRIHDEKGNWTWINFNSLLIEMPLLRIKSISSLSRRISNIREAGFLETKRIDNQKLFVKLNSLTDELFFKRNSSVLRTQQPPIESCSPNATNQYTNNTDQYTKSIHYSFDSFWTLYPKKQDKKKAQIKWDRLPEETRRLIMLDLPKRIVGHKWQAGFIENPTTYLNGERWEDEIETPRIGIAPVGSKYDNLKKIITN